jgi:hypothetical protein
MSEPKSKNAMKHAELASLERSLPGLRRQRWGGKGDNDAHKRHEQRVAEVETRISNLKRELR